MRAVVQRVSRAQVTVADDVVGGIGAGLLVYLGSSDGDGPNDLAYIADKIAGLRIFPDSEGKMNLSVADIGGEVLVVPAFTTMADARQGRRPAFIKAARPESAEPAYLAVVESLRQRGLTVATGKFRESMTVESENAGPICILLDSAKLF